MNHEITFAEHIIFNFPENIISRFDDAVNDVVKEFAKTLQIKYFPAQYFRFCEVLIRIKKKISCLIKIYNLF